MNKWRDSMHFLHIAFWGSSKKGLLKNYYTNFLSRWLPFHISPKSMHKDRAMQKLLSSGPFGPLG